MNKPKCAHCSSLIDSSIVGLRYCSDVCRIAHNKDNRQCFLCGHKSKVPLEPHVVPRRWDTPSGQAYLCSECVSTYDTIGSAKLSVVLTKMIAVYTKDYKLDKPFTFWDETDLSAVSRHMNEWIYKRQKERLVVERRVSYMALTRLQLLKNKG